MDLYNELSEIEYERVLIPYISFKEKYRGVDIWRFNDVSGAYQRNECPNRFYFYGGKTVNSESKIKRSHIKGLVSSSVASCRIGKDVPLYSARKIIDKTLAALYKNLNNPNFKVCSTDDYRKGDYIIYSGYQKDLRSRLFRQ